VKTSYYVIWMENSSNQRFIFLVRNIYIWIWIIKYKTKLNYNKIFDLICYLADWRNNYYYFKKHLENIDRNKMKRNEGKTYVYMNTQALQKHMVVNANAFIICEYNSLNNWIDWGWSIKRLNYSLSTTSLLLY
jgi:hypothetical protein